jgi:hydroxyacyl-ACP dehydratase HTD2-like protein with hotdog domain
MSAVTRNDHKIHFDADYCRNVENLQGELRLLFGIQEFSPFLTTLLPGPVVHGPLTALLLLDSFSIYVPKSRRISRFTYRATNPLFVNEKCILQGAFTDPEKYTAKLWAANEAGVVGMTADVIMSENPGSLDDGTNELQLPSSLIY